MNKYLAKIFVIFSLAITLPVQLSSGTQVAQTRTGDRYAQEDPDEDFSMFMPMKEDLKAAAAERKRVKRNKGILFTILVAATGGLIFFFVRKRHLRKKEEKKVEEEKEEEKNIEKQILDYEETREALEKEVKILDFEKEIIEKYFQEPFEAFIVKQEYKDEKIKDASAYWSHFETWKGRYKKLYPKEMYGTYNCKQLKEEIENTKDKDKNEEYYNMLEYRGRKHINNEDVDKATKYPVKEELELLHNIMKEFRAEDDIEKITKASIELLKEKNDEKDATTFKERMETKTNEDQDKRTRAEKIKKKLDDLDLLVNNQTTPEEKKKKYKEIQEKEAYKKIKDAYDDAVEAEKTAGQIITFIDSSEENNNEWSDEVALLDLKKHLEFFDEKHNPIMALKELGTEKDAKKILDAIQKEIDEVKTPPTP